MRHPGLECRRYDDGMHQEAVRVGDDVTFAAFGFLACIIASYPAAFGRFDRLTVDHTSTGRGLTALRNPGILYKIMVYPRPRPIIAPGVKIVLHRSCWWKARRHHPPGQTAAQHIK